MRSSIGKHKETVCQLGQKCSKTTQRTKKKHTMEIVAMKRANLDTQNILTTKTTPAQAMNDHRTTDHFNAMTKPSETLFDVTPEN
jgi:hypothetical protein